MTIKREELYREMFDQSWRHLAENFYDDKFHGLNWGRGGATSIGH